MYKECGNVSFNKNEGVVEHKLIVTGYFLDAAGTNLLTYSDIKDKAIHLKIRTEMVRRNVVTIGKRYTDHKIVFPYNDEQFDDGKSVEYIEEKINRSHLDYDNYDKVLYTDHQKNNKLKFIDSVNNNIQGIATHYKITADGAVLEYDVNPNRTIGYTGTQKETVTTMVGDPAVPVITESIATVDAVFTDDHTTLINPSDGLETVDENGFKYKFIEPTNGREKALFASHVDSIPAPNEYVGNSYILRGELNEKITNHNNLVNGEHFSDDYNPSDIIYHDGRIYYKNSIDGFMYYKNVTDSITDPPILFLANNILRVVHTITNGGKLIYTATNNKYIYIKDITDADPNNIGDLFIKRDHIESINYIKEIDKVIYIYYPDDTDPHYRRPFIKSLDINNELDFGVLANDNKWAGTDYAYCPISNRLVYCGDEGNILLYKSLDDFKDGTINTSSEATLVIMDSVHIPQYILSNNTVMYTNHETVADGYEYRVYMKSVIGTVSISDTGTLFLNNSYILSICDTYVIHRSHSDLLIYKKYLNNTDVDDMGELLLKLSVTNSLVVTDDLNYMFYVNNEHTSFYQHMFKLDFNQTIIPILPMTISIKDSETIKLSTIENKYSYHEADRNNDNEETNGEYHLMIEPQLYTEDNPAIKKVANDQNGFTLNKLMSNSLDKAVMAILNDPIMKELNVTDFTFDDHYTKGITDYKNYFIKPATIDKIIATFKNISFNNYYITIELPNKIECDNLSFNTANIKYKECIVDVKNLTITASSLSGVNKDSYCYFTVSESTTLNALTLLTKSNIAFSSKSVDQENFDETTLDIDNININFDSTEKDDAIIRFDGYSTVNITSTTINGNITKSNIFSFNNINLVKVDNYINNGKNKLISDIFFNNCGTVDISNVTATFDELSKKSFFMSFVLIDGPNEIKLNNINLKNINLFNNSSKVVNKITLSNIICNGNKFIRNTSSIGKLAINSSTIVVDEDITLKGSTIAIDKTIIHCNNIKLTAYESLIISDPKTTLMIKDLFHVILSRMSVVELKNIFINSKKTLLEFDKTILVGANTSEVILVKPSITSTESIIFNDINRLTPDKPTFTTDTLNFKLNNMIGNKMDIKCNIGLNEILLDVYKITNTEFNLHHTSPKPINFRVINTSGKLSIIHNNSLTGKKDIPVLLNVVDSKINCLVNNNAYNTTVILKHKNSLSSGVLTKNNKVKIIIDDSIEDFKNSVKHTKKINTRLLGNGKYDKFYYGTIEK